MNFVALDVETANSDMASICQIGIARYSDGQLVEEWTSYINPEDYFSPINVGIHGITENTIKDSPTFPDIFGTLNRFLTNTICVCHTPFDRTSLRRAFEKYAIDAIEIVWLDSASVTRRTWPDCARSGYGLENICKIIGFDFKHHDALEDAKAAGEVLLAAINKTGLDIDSWLKRAKQPIDPKNSSCGSAVNREGNPEGELSGENMVFTGEIEFCRNRKEAADMAASIGCNVSSNVTKKTSILVVGHQDLFKLAGKDKSNSHIYAEKLISRGQNIRILKESDFIELVKDIK